MTTRGCFAFVFALALAAPVHAGQLTVALAPFAHADPALAEAKFCADATEAVQLTLATRQTWPLVERSQLADIEAELGLSAGGWVNTASVVRLGKLAKADLLVTGRFESPHGSPIRLTLEAIDVFHADLLATRSLPLDTQPDEDGVLRTLRPGDVTRITDGIDQLLHEAQPHLQTVHGQRVIAPLFFRNTSASPRLNRFEPMLIQALDRAAEKSSHDHVLRLARPDASFEESRLVLSGLVDFADHDWQQVADRYVWGSFAEAKDSGNRPFEQVEVTANVTVWNGSGEPVEINATGRAGQLQKLADDLAAKILAVPPTGPSTSADSPEPRRRVAAQLWSRASEQLSDYNYVGSSFESSPQAHALGRHLIDTMEAACFFAPGNRIYQEARIRKTLGFLEPDHSRVADLARHELAEDYLRLASAHWHPEGTLDLDLQQRAIQALAESISSFSSSPFDASHMLLNALQAQWASELMKHILATDAVVRRLPPIELQSCTDIYQEWVHWILYYVQSPRERISAFESLWPVYGVQFGALSRKGGEDFEAFKKSIAMTYLTNGNSDPRLESPPTAFPVAPQNAAPPLHLTHSTAAELAPVSRPPAISLPPTTSTQSSKRHQNLGPPDSAMPATNWNALPVLNLGRLEFSPWPVEFFNHPGQPENLHTIEHLLATDDALWIIEKSPLKSSDKPVEREEAALCPPATQNRFWRLDLAHQQLTDLSAQFMFHSSVTTLAWFGDHVWAGTQLEGLRRIDPHTLAADAIGTQQGLLADGIAALQPAGNSLFVASEGNVDFYTRDSLTGRTIADKEHSFISRFDAPTARWVDIREKAPPQAFDHPLPDEVVAARPQFHLSESLRAIVRAQPPALTDYRAYFKSHPGPYEQTDGLIFTLSADGHALWLARSSALELLDADGETFVTLLPAAIAALADDGHFLFVVVGPRKRPPGNGSNYPSDPGQAFARQPDPIVSRLFVLDRQTGTWVGQMSFQGIVRVAAATPGHLWLGLADERRPLIELCTRALANPTPTPSTGNADLFTAAYRGDIKRIETLLGAGANANEATSDGWTPLLAAVYGGHTDAVSRLLKAGAKIDVSDARGWHPLAIAYSQRDSTLLAQLRQAGASIDYQGADPAWQDFTFASYTQRPVVRAAPNHPAHRNLLLLAVLAQDESFVDSLLAAGANPNAQDAEGSTPLHYAVMANSKALVTRLLAAKADPAIADTAGRNAHTLALQLNHQSVFPPLQNQDAHVDAAQAGQMLYERMDSGLTAAEAKSLIDGGADVSWAYGSGETALSRAIRLKREDIVQLLLDRGFDPKKSYTSFWKETGLCGYIALCEAVTADRIDLVKRLLAAGALPDKGDGGIDESPIRRAIEKNNADILRLLLDHANKPVSPFLLFDAAEQKNLAALDLLLDHGADPNKLNTNETTVLMLAARLGWRDGVQHLLARGADRHIADAFDKIALDYAKSPEVIALFSSPASLTGSNQPVPDGATLIAAIKNGDESRWGSIPLTPDVINYRDDKGWTPLIHALKAHRLDLARKLIAAGSPLNMLTNFGSAPICFAAETGDVDLVEEMIRRGAQVDARGGTHGTALYAAAHEGHADVVKVLLAHGADPNVKVGDTNADTPTLVAARAPTTVTLQLLIAAGANIHILNGNGYGILYYAIRSDNPDTIQFLLNRGARWEDRPANGDDPLTVCIDASAPHSARKLLELGLHNPDALVFAARKGDPAVLNVFMEFARRDHAPALRNLEFWGTMLRPVRHTHAEIEAFLQSGGDINFRGDETPLQLALMQHDFDLATFLLEKGADPRIDGAGGHGDVEYSIIDEVLVVQNRADSATDHIIAKMVHLLLSHGVDPNYGTPLFQAAESGLPETTRVLLEAGADPHRGNQLGNDTFSAIKNSVHLSEEQRHTMLEILGEK